MSLTEQQQQIVQLSLSGVAPNDIAERLGRSRSAIYAAQDRLKRSGYLAKEGNRFVPGPALKGTEFAGTLPAMPEGEGIGALVQQAHQTLEAIDREIERRRQEIALLEAHRKALQNLAQTSGELLG